MIQKPLYICIILLFNMFVIKSDNMTLNVELKIPEIEGIEKVRKITNFLSNLEILQYDCLIKVQGKDEPDTEKKYCNEIVTALRSDPLLSSIESILSVEENILIRTRINMEFNKCHRSNVINCEEPSEIIEKVKNDVKKNYQNQIYLM